MLLLFLLFTIMQKKTNILNAILLIAVAIFFIYSNTFHASWHFDDEPNILLNSKLQISELSIEQLRQAMSANPVSPESGKLYRPLPCLTFGLNWYFGQDNVRGYHAVNTAIHILTAWLLFLTLRLLLHLHYEDEDSRLIEAAALLGALFWALAPIQTQAVTYIVQRMASMAAMFAIAAIYAYLRGRRAANGNGKSLWYLLCLLCFFAALGSKENAILLLPSLALVEFSFFRHQITKRQIILSALAAVLALIAAAFFVRHGLGLAPFSFSNPLSFLDSYSNRSFTFSQRILTQPRILLMYLSQIFLPVADRLSIEHELVLSTSLFSPWTTLPSIAVILSLIGGSLFFLKKYPLLCFPILFYFLNHAVESTILQLELVFEHRNYLPSLFLFLPLGVLTARILHGTPSQPAFRRAAAAVCATLFLIVSGHATYTRNMAWATDETLWTDAIKKAPNSARAAGHLGEWYRKRGQDETAYRYIQLSLAQAKDAPSPEDATITALNELGVFHYNWNDNEKALNYFNECLSLGKYNAYCLKNRMLVFLRLNHPKQALGDAEILIGRYPFFLEYRYLSAFSSYKAQDFDTALKAISSAGSAFDNYQVMRLIGLILLKKQAYQNSLFFLKTAEELFPSLEGKIALAAVYYFSGRGELLDEELRSIFNNYSKVRIDASIRENSDSVLDNKMKKYFNDKLAELAIKSIAKQ